MKRFLALALLVCPIPAFAQYWPKPSPQANTPVQCVAPAKCAGQGTAPYSPSLHFVGRYLDSTTQRQFQEPFRTVRAWHTVAAPNGVYMQVGSAIVRYDSLFTRLASGEQLIPVTQLHQTQAQGSPEILLRPQALFYARDTVWREGASEVDGDVKLFKFDIDDRGLVYPNTTEYGWGILDANLQTLSHEAQVEAYNGVWLKNGGRYYRVVSPQNGSSSRLYDVTSPTNPQFIGTVPYVVRESAHAANGDAAVVDSAGKVRIITTQDTPTSGGRVAQPSGKEIFYSVASDGAGFFATEAERGGETEIAVFSAPTYQRSDIGIGLTYSDAPAVVAGAGYLAVSGFEAHPSWIAPNVRLFKIGAGNSLVAVPLTVGSAMGSPVDQFIPNYYFSGVARSVPGYMAPDFTGIGLSSLGNGALIPSGSKAYMVLTEGSLGDVFEIGAASPPQPCPTLTPPPPPAAGCSWTVDTSGACPVHKLTCATPQPQPNPQPGLDLSAVRSALAAALSAGQAQATAIQAALAALDGAPTPAPQPVPTPVPAPVPTPVPIPTPTPVPQPIPTPAPQPQPATGSCTQTAGSPARADGCQCLVVTPDGVPHWVKRSQGGLGPYSTEGCQQ